MSTMIAILYFITIYLLEKLGGSTIWKPSIRGVLADYAYVVGQGCYGLVNAILRLSSLDRDYLLGGIRPHSGNT